jgi:DnaJ-class molecular chaperone
MTLREDSAFAELGLAPDATALEVKQRYRALSMTLHPDRGGSAEEFARMQNLYHVALAAARAPKPCLVCSGTGAILKQHGWNSIELACPRCGGSMLE